MRRNGRAELWNGRKLMPRRNNANQLILDAVLESRMTNRQIAEACGVTESQMSQALHRTEECQFPALKRICNFLCVDVEKVCPSRKEVKMAKKARTRFYKESLDDWELKDFGKTLTGVDFGETVRILLSKTTKRERTCLKMYFGIGCEVPKDATQIGRVYNKNKGTIRQMMITGMRKMRRFLEGDGAALTEELHKQLNAAA